VKLCTKEGPIALDASTSADQGYFDWLRSVRVIFGRPTSTTSVLVDHGGRRCLAAFTSVEPMVTWWKQRSNKSLRTISLPVSELAEGWGAPDVDLLIDPGTPQEMYVPIASLRAHLSLGPVIADGDGTEPLRFAGFSTSLYSGAKGLTLVPFSLMVAVLGIAAGSLGLALAGLAIFAVSLLIARSTFRELRAAIATRQHRRATRAAASL
jgi:SseB protein N-terminal domain